MTAQQATAAAPAALSEGDATAGEPLGRRALRTREAILDASRKLFLERGYAGTRINNITDACGISRAGFYTYFKDKREVFNLLGQTAYDDILAVIARWDNMPTHPSLDEIVEWVNAYFTFMDRHGAFIFSSAQSAPSDDDVRMLSKRMQLRVAFLLGMHLRARQQEPTSAPEALGLTALAGLDRSWFLVTVQDLGVDRTDVVQAIASVIHRGVGQV
ncbi:TetR/AcrR family transcriptional regulator [Janibacter hoylei]|uniref:Transcriptional regulator n=1 Tax=Janibacter indicus TaxID=857417 RepID=A0A1L3MJ69_9MICO|nr:TetR/AcrR family transcriptional regulator [Janibacter indicus]APH02417.1 transcriptional regulator [Janibacter indicus]